MKKILYKRLDGEFYTSGSQVWKKKIDRNRVLDSQRKKSRMLVKDFRPSRSKEYHLKAIFHLRPKRIGSDLDNLLKEFNDAVFGKHGDQRIYSVSAQKVSNPRERVRFWVYELVPFQKNNLVLFTKKMQLRGVNHERTPQWPYMFVL